jgi:metallo-beta-lactamase family protein
MRGGRPDVSAATMLEPRPIMSERLTIEFHGAARTVTGSCMEFVLDGKRLLVDCGLFQGSRTLEALNHGPFRFGPRAVDAVVLTHAHIDHSGLLPKLVANGYDRAIWCTAPTADLLEYLLSDAGRIQEGEAERRNRRRDRADEPPIEPVYTEADGYAAWRLSRPVALGEWFEPVEGFRCRLWNAGHILGSASVEIEAGGTLVLCSGDLGPEHKSFHPDPQGASDFDHVICEATYGNRTREHLDPAARRTLLAAEVTAALRRGGNLIIPVFALERTQELLLDIGKLIDERRIGDVSVFIDSPLASRATRVFAKHAAALEDTGGANIFDRPSFKFVEDTNESIRLNSLSGGIILAASGMCEAGRIRHHLKHNLWRREATILFVGYQAEGTLGRTILEGAKRVRMWGEDVVVRAQIRRLDNYSAHADQGELLSWIEGCRPVSGGLFLTHGEAEAIAELSRLAAPFVSPAPVIVPELGERYALAADAPPKRLSTGDLTAQQAVGRDWQNSYADFATSLKRELAAIESAQARQEAIERMRAVLNGYHAARDKRAGRPRAARR